MSRTLPLRISRCCWRSLLGDIPPLPLRRSLVTLQRAPVAKVDIPADLPSQFWPQLPERIRPGRIKRDMVVHEPPRSEAQLCKDPVGVVDQSQLALLDPTGARARLFDKTNKDRARVGDTLLTTFKNGEQASGVILSITGSGPHLSVLLRNQLTTVGMELSIKVHSPLVQSMEVASRTPKRKRRARLYYLRKPEHDVGSVQKVVDQYLRQRAMLTGGKSSRQHAGPRSKRGKR